MDFFFLWKVAAFCGNLTFYQKQKQKNTTHTQKSGEGSLEAGGAPSFSALNQNISAKTEKMQ